MSFLIDNPYRDNNLLNTKPVYEEDEVLIEGMTTNSIYELADYNVHVIKQGIRHIGDVQRKRDIYNTLNTIRDFY